jgi:FkbM family methyltransferase
MSKINIPSKNLGSYDIPGNCGRGVCVDIGANIGDFTIAHASSFTSLHFYEPYTPCYDLVVNRTAQFSNVVGWNEAVYKSDDEVVSIVAHNNYDAGSNAIKTDVLNDDWVESVQQISTVSLPTIIERVGGHIDYLKIDCETSEYYLLIHQDLSNIDYIGIELHWQMGKERYDELIAHINKTHTTNGDFEWLHDANKEVTFSNKKMI